MDEGVEEELEMMAEESRRGSVELDADLFEQPASVLCKFPPLKLELGATVGQAADLMRDNRRGAVVVTDHGKLVGIVTERDLLMKVSVESGPWRDRPVAEIMTHNPDCLMMDDAVKFVMNRMHVGGYRHIPIVNEDGEPIFVIALRDVLGFVLDHFPNLVSNIPPRPPRGAPPWGG
jgi:CBS domain-containing protein